MFPPGLSVLIILLPYIVCPSWILQTGIGTFVIPPCLIPVQIGKQMLPHIFVFVPDQSEAKQKGAERKCRVIPYFRLFAWVQDWLIACADMASASVIFDRTFPAWRVLSKQRHSSVPLEKQRVGLMHNTLSSCNARSFRHFPHTMPF